MGLENKVAAITGGTGGLGRAVTRAFLDAGATVVVMVHVERRRDELLEYLGGPHPRLMMVSADVTREDQVRAFIQEAVDEYGRLDILVHLVGGYVCDIPVAKLEEATWDRMIALNLKSAFLCFKTALGHMLDQGSGKIIAVGAQGAVTFVPGSVAYAVAKAGVHTLVQAVSREVRGENIHVNAVVPGIIDTPANRQAMPQADASRWIKPDALAKVILFLASDAANSLHGVLIPVRGGG